MATLGVGSKRYEDTRVFRRAEFRKFKKKQANIFQVSMNKEWCRGILKLDPKEAGDILIRGKEMKKEKV